LRRAALALPPRARYPICMPCVQWYRRAKKSRATSSKKIFTPLDRSASTFDASNHVSDSYLVSARSILLHVLCPGRFPDPDLRCYARLSSVAADPENGFASTVPDTVRRILGAARESPAARSVLREWWRANDSTPCFRHAETARAIRHSFVYPDEAQLSARRRWRR